MSDYISREAAKQAVVKAVGVGHSPFNAIVMLPAADVVPVVRCKDCKHYEQLDLFRNSPVWSGMCHYWNSHATREDGFCFKAAKMEGSE